MTTQDEEMTIHGLAKQNFIDINYYDEDIIIVDNIKKFVEPSTTRLRMNMIVIARKGKAEVSINGHKMTIGENQLLLCPPKTVFSDFMSSPDFDFKAVFLSDKIIQSFLREKINVWNEVMYVHKLNIVTMKPVETAFFYSFYDALRICISTPVDSNPYRTEVIQSLLRSAFLGLCGDLKALLPNNEKQSRSQSDTLFQRFLNLVNKGGSKSRTVETYAAELCVSAKYLTVVCKKNSGKTANEWIRQHMLEEIRYYLKHTNLSMKQVADKLGFANPSFFGKYVKDHFGKTPMCIRQEK